MYMYIYVYLICETVKFKKNAYVMTYMGSLCCHKIMDQFVGTLHRDFGVHMIRWLLQLETKMMCYLVGKQRGPFD